MPRKGEALVNTGHNSVFVNTTRPHPMGPTVGTHEVVQVYEGEAIPADVTDAEVERLRGLGVFDEHARTKYGRMIDGLVEQGLAKRGGLTPDGGGSGQADDGEGPGPEDDDDDDGDPDGDDFDNDSTV